MSLSKTNFSGVSLWNNNPNASKDPYSYNQYSNGTSSSSGGSSGLSDSDLALLAAYAYALNNTPQPKKYYSDFNLINGSTSSDYINNFGDGVV